MKFRQLGLASFPKRGGKKRKGRHQPARRLGSGSFLGRQPHQQNMQNRMTGTWHSEWKGDMSACILKIHPTYCDYEPHTTKKSNKYHSIHVPPQNMLISSMHTSFSPISQPAFISTHPSSVSFTKVLAAGSEMAEFTGMSCQCEGMPRPLRPILKTSQALGGAKRSGRLVL